MVQKPGRKEFQEGSCYKCEVPLRGQIRNGGGRKMPWVWRQGGHKPECQQQILIKTPAPARPGTGPGIALSKRLEPSGAADS